MYFNKFYSCALSGKCDTIAADSDGVVTFFIPSSCAKILLFNPCSDFQLPLQVYSQLYNEIALRLFFVQTKNKKMYKPTLTKHINWVDSDGVV